MLLRQFMASTPFPYTTLFRSCVAAARAKASSAASSASSRWRILPTRSPSWPITEESTPTASASSRSEEHTSELQSRRDLVCRLLLEKKKLAQEAKDSGVHVRK